MGRVSQLFSEWSGRQIPGHGLEVGGAQLDRHRCLTLALLYRVWDRGKSLLGISGFTKLSPLWDNPALPEIQKLRGFDNWARCGITALSQVQGCLPEVISRPARGILPAVHLLLPIFTTSSCAFCILH